MLRLIAGTLVSTLLFAAIIMGPAYAFTHSLDWPQGWIVVISFFIVSAVGGLYFQMTDPDLVRERAQVPQTKTAADTRATLCILLCVIGFCAAAVYDSLKVQLLPLSPTLSLVTGAVVFMIGVTIVGWTFRVNSFATTIVEVQQAREQRVIDTGPYSLVRHPMYLGAVWFFAGVAMMLGSPALSLAATILFPLAFWPRMRVEEAVLRRDLPGYEAYQARVRKRILPWIL